MQSFGKILETSYNGVHHILHRTVQTGSNQDTKRSRRWINGGQKLCRWIKNVRICSWKNRCITGLQLYPQYPQNTSLIVSSEKALECQPYWQSLKEKAISNTGQVWQTGIENALQTDRSKLRCLDQGQIYKVSNIFANPLLHSAFGQNHCHGDILFNPLTSVKLLLYNNSITN